MNGTGSGSATLMALIHLQVEVVMFEEVLVSEGDVDGVSVVAGVVDVGVGEGESVGVDTVEMFADVDKALVIHPVETVL